MSVNPFAGLEPSRVFTHFEALTQCRRPSGEEEEAAAYVEGWAQEQGFAVETDAVGNRIVRVPGTAGREHASPVLLQGHLDMVCERNGDSPYDAAEGRLRVLRDGDWIRADGTTLGADNGIGVACAMAAAEELEHGPLELLFTIDEETGLTGAQQLDASRITARVMLNLDSEEDTILYVGCAGGMDSRLRLPLERATATTGAVQRRVAIKGLKGGHSGGDIHLDRLNAIHALVRLLQRAGHGRLVSLMGGSKRNAIPREAEAVVSLDPADADAFAAGIDRGAAELRQGWGEREPQLAVDVGSADESLAPCTTSCTGRVLAMLRALPSGIVALSQDIEGLVETSTNLGVVTSDADSLSVVLCSRSSVPSAMRGVLDTIAGVASLAGAEVDEHGGYPGWRPNLDSEVLATTSQAYQTLFGEAPEVTAIHAGLECGLIGERIPGMDMVSFGPNILGAHSPDERVSISSVQKVYRLLAEVLRTVA